MVKRRKSQVPLPPPDCPLRHCMGLLAGAWTPEVLWFLRAGERCFSELQMDLRGVSAKVLTSRLRKLEKHGVILRYGKPTSPPTTWYALTPLGEELCTAMDRILDIGRRLKQAPASSAP